MDPESRERAASRTIRRGQLEVIAAALAFAASVPASKLLLEGVAPLALSGTLYVSAGLLCTLLVLFARRSTTARAGNAIQESEWGWLAGAVLSGGILAPLLLFLG